MKKSHLPHRCLYAGFGKEIVRIFKMKFLRNAGVGMSYHGIPAIPAEGGNYVEVCPVETQKQNKFHIYVKHIKIKVTFAP